MKSYENLLAKITSRRVKVGVVGLGYVGLPLALLMAKKNFTVVGLGRDVKKLALLNTGKNLLPDLVLTKDLTVVLRSGKFQAKLISGQTLQALDVIIVCVPTPVAASKKPDLSALKSVAKLLGAINLNGKLIINESTVAPLTTRKIFGGFKGQYFLASSPERVDPGNPEKPLAAIAKLVGGYNRESTVLTTRLYEMILGKKMVVAVSGLEVAEMSKMLENTYRAVNIALINEVARLCDRLGLDVLEVIAAAKSKWSFQPHYPGIGVGGHCIPVDPYYLLDLADSFKLALPTVAQSLKTNEAMPAFLLKKLLAVYRKGQSVLVYGLAYKKNVADLRESPAVIFCQLLKKAGVEFGIYDPLVSKAEVAALGFQFRSLFVADIFVVATDHDALKKDYQSAVGKKTVIIDGRNFFRKKAGRKIIGVGRNLL